MNMIKDYVYEKEIDWSALTDGITLPVSENAVFGMMKDRSMKKGDKKTIKIIFNGEMYDAKIINVNFSKKYQEQHKNDILQIRYNGNRELIRALISSFQHSYEYIKNKREINKQLGDKSLIKLPENGKEYLAIYTTDSDSVFCMEPIYAEDISALREYIGNTSERFFESEFNYDIQDETATITETERTVKVRRLNKKIGDSLKQLYGYRCQICGQLIGEEYASHVAEAHHIDYYVKSLNNNATNQMIVCPNHHSIIHNVNPEFDRNKLIYIYPNGYKEGLRLNEHL